MSTGVGSRAARTLRYPVTREVPGSERRRSTGALGYCPVVTGGLEPPLTERMKLPIWPLIYVTVPPACFEHATTTS